MIWAGELRVLGHPHPQLGPLELQRLGHVVTDDLPGPVLGTVLLGRRDFRGHFIPRQVFGQLLAPRPPRLDPAADGDLFAGFRLLGSRVGQPVGCCCVLAEVELLLSRILVPFATMAPQLSQQLLDRQV